MDPLRRNAVEAFEEKTTGTKSSPRIPWLDWEIVPDPEAATYTAMELRLEPCWSR